jgi:PTH1 family peptidyl-tRNA hydrolase
LLVALGLGNPGDRYRQTRHNLGQEVITSLIEELRLRPVEGKGQYYYAIDPAKDICLAVPTTYVNTSGISALQVIDHLGITSSDLLVVCDDFSLPLGAVRIRARGSDGGHNGLASIIFQLETQDIPRLRLGVGPVPQGVDPADFVLSCFRPQEGPVVKELKQIAAEAVLAVASDGIERAMNKYNRRAEA